MAQDEESWTEFNKGRKELHGVRMTQQEKQVILQNILSSDALKRQSVRSPYVFSYFVSKFSEQRTFSYLSIFCLFVLLGGGAVLASEGSLPGGVLYPLKVNIVEPIGSAFVFSPVGKMQYESGLATRRLVEAELLVERGELDQSKEEKLDILLDNHVDAVDEAVLEFHQKNTPPPELSEEVLTDFHSSLHQARQFFKESREENEKGNRENAHKKLLDSEMSVEVGRALLQSSLKSKDLVQEE